MLIDWFTVGAQALNFLILVWLLKRFLYRPILQAIDAREQLIAKELADAAAMKSEAERERGEFTHKSEAFDHDRAALLAHAIDEARAERQRLLDEARQAADAMTVKRQDLLQGEMRDLYISIGRRTQDEVFAIARKALTDLASASLEEHLAAAFALRLQDLRDPVKTSLCNDLRSAQNPALLRSAFELPAAQRAALQETINVMCSSDINLQFETAPEVIGGIELTCSGNKVSWSLAEYLRSLEKSVDELLQKQARQAAMTAPAEDAPPESALGDEAEHGAAAAHREPKLPAAGASGAAPAPPAIEAPGTAVFGPAGPAAPALPTPKPQQIPA